MSSPLTGSLFKPFGDEDGLASSIWAPKPAEQPDPRWLPAADRFARPFVNDYVQPPRRASLFREEGQAAPVPVRGINSSFGPPNFPSPSLAALRRSNIGTIGEGRQRSATPDFDDAHIAQLLRTLDLNSPTQGPYFDQPSLLSSSFDATPDLSPSSQSSALLTPADMSPSRPGVDLKLSGELNFGPVLANAPRTFAQNGPFVEPITPERERAPSFLPVAQSPLFGRGGQVLPPVYEGQQSPLSQGLSFEPFSPSNSPLASGRPQLPPIGQPPLSSPPQAFDLGNHHRSGSTWGPRQLQSQPTLPAADWLREDDVFTSNRGELKYRNVPPRMPLQPFPNQPQPHVQTQSHDPINFLSLLHPSSSPPYHAFVARIIKSSDQQASIFLQQKLKVADTEERAKIIDAICSRGFEMMAHRFGNWAVQRCLEAATSADERRKLASCMRDRVVELAMNCYGCHVLQKALDCEEDIRLLIVSELLLGDPAQTLVNKHASHVWSKIMELTWTPPAPPIFAFVNKSLKGKWASLACHETGSLVVQHAFENLEEGAKDDIVDELLNRGPVIFAEVTKSQWGSYCIQHILEHGSQKHRQMTLDHLTAGLLEYATNEQGAKSVNKALKEGGKEVVDRFVKRMAESIKGGRRAMIVDLALSATGSQLIANVLPHVDKEQRTLLYDSIRSHIVTLRGCKTGSKVIWLFDRMRAYYGY